MDKFVRGIGRRTLGMKAEKTQTLSPPDNWGTHYPEDYLKWAFDIWIRSEFQIWPNGLSYDDQSPDLIEDFMVLLADLDLQIALLNDEKTNGGKAKMPDVAQPIPGFDEV